LSAVKKNTVLFVSYDGLSDPLGQSQIIPYLKALSDEYEISILSCEKSDRLMQEKQNILAKLKEVGINWRYATYHKRPAIFSTIFDLMRMRAKAKSWNRQKRFNIVHCRSILGYMIGSKLKTKTNSLIFDFRGFWAEERVDGGLWDKTNIIYYQVYHFFKRAETKALKASDAIVSLTKAAKDELVDKQQIEKAKISVVPCSADQSHFIPKSDLLRSTIDLRENLRLDPSSLVIGYAGSLGTRYMLKEMLDCFKVILNTHPQAIFLIITVSPLIELKRLIKEMGIESNIIVSGSSYVQIPRYMALMDVALYFIKPGNSGKAVSPTKQAEFLSMGIPIVTNQGIGDSKRIIQHNNVGLVIDELSEDAYSNIADTIEQLRAIPAAEIVKVAKAELSLKSGVETYRSLYHSL